MSSQARSGAVLYAKHLERVTGFYEGVVGLRATHSEPDHAVLESLGFQLVVVSIPDAIASTIQIANPPLRRTDVPVKLIYFVPSIAASRDAAARLGGELNPTEREWQAEGSIVCDGHDPEGNVFQLRQSAG